MSYKAELKTVIESYQGFLKQAINDIDTARDSGQYTYQGIQQKTQEISEAFQKNTEALQTKALNIIDRAEAHLVKDVEKSTISYLHDSGHQTGLANALRMIENSLLTSADAKNIVEAFKNDNLAVRSLKAAFLANPVQGFVAEFPATQEDNLDALAQLRKNVAKLVRPISPDNNYAVKMVSSWLLKAMDNLNDNLQLLNK